MKAYEELFAIAKKLIDAAEVGDSEEISIPLNRLYGAAQEVSRSFSGSWLGYHSCVYYDGLISVPAGANFSQEWGLKDLRSINDGSEGDWRQYEKDEVTRSIKDRAGNPDLTEANSAKNQAEKIFMLLKSEIQSIIHSEIHERKDNFLQIILDNLTKLNLISKIDFMQSIAPRGQIMTRDTIALGQGTKIPPHVDMLAEVTSIRHSFGLCRTASDLSRQAASHLERKSRSRAAAERVGTNVFIGHGRSNLWLELKDFVQDRLRLPWDEFNRIPVAGLTNIARLSEMLDAAAIAFLIMTAEDETVDGALQARMNVIHEAGLFQGRLGFSRSIILLEESCSEFSNIQGLGQIRFPRGNISAAFEEIRRVMEREGLVSGPT